MIPASWIRRRLLGAQRGRSTRRGVSQTVGKYAYELLLNYVAATLLCCYKILLSYIAATYATLLERVWLHCPRASRSCSTRLWLLYKAIAKRRMLGNSKCLFRSILNCLCVGKVSSLVSSYVYSQIRQIANLSLVETQARQSYKFLK